MYYEFYAKKLFHKKHDIFGRVFIFRLSILAEKDIKKDAIFIASFFIIINHGIAWIFGNSFHPKAFLYASTLSAGT